VASDRWSNQSDKQLEHISSNDETLPAELDDLSRQTDVGGRSVVETTANGGMGNTDRSSVHSPVAGGIQKRTVTSSLSTDRTRQRGRQRERGLKYGYVDANGSRDRQNRNRTALPSTTRDRHRLRQLHGGRNKGKSSAYWSGSWLSANENGRQSDAAYSGSSPSKSPPAADRNPTYKEGTNEMMPYFGGIPTDASAAAAAASSTFGRKDGEYRNGSRPGVDDNAVVSNKVTVVDAGGGAGAGGWAVGRGGGERGGMVTSDMAMLPSTTTNEIDAVESTCDKMKCQRGGECVAAETTKTAPGVRCRCPLGTRGQHCEQGCLNCFYPSGASVPSNCRSVCATGRHFFSRTKFSVLFVSLVFHRVDRPVITVHNPSKPSSRRLGLNSKFVRRSCQT
jgi:hypothetical protein